MADVYEYYITGDTTSSGGIPLWDVGDALCQTFTPSETHTITQVRLKLYRNSTPGDIRVDIYAVNESHYPTGASLASGVTDGNTLTTNSAGSYRQITLDNTAVLQANTEYALVLTAPNGVPGEKTVLWRIDIADSAYAGGWAIKYFGTLENPTPQSWQIFAEGLVSDFMFQEWGEPASPSKPTNPSPAHQATEVDFSGLTLSWEDGGDADTFDVYIGPSASLTKVSDSQADTSYITSIAELESVFGASPINQKIYWRVDAKNESGVTQGDEWWFDARPAKPTNPTPEDEYDEMTLDWTTFSWT